MGLFSLDPKKAERPGAIRQTDVEVLLQDLEAGAKYQQSLMPAQMPKVAGYDLAALIRPARQVSGDFYDAFPAGPNRLGIVVADASGKGIPACLLAVMCQLLFKIRPEPDAGPARTLANVNHMLLGNVKRGTFVSGIYAILDTSTHTLTMANAGHLPAVVWHSRAKVATTHRSNGPILGVLGAAAFEREVKEETVRLDPGDRFVLFTDGMNEAMAPGQKEFGMEHLRKRLVAQSDGPSADFLRDLTSQLDLHAGGGEQSDDITIVTGRRTQ